MGKQEVGGSYRSLCLSLTQHLIGYARVRRFVELPSIVFLVKWKMCSAGHSLVTQKLRESRAKQQGKEEGAMSYSAAKVNVERRYLQNNQGKKRKSTNNHFVQ